METLVDDLLSLTQGGQDIGEMERVALDTLIEECWTNVQTGAAGLHVETERVVLADKSCLKQLLENLFRNAVEHGGEGVSVSVGELENGFYVEDDGVGIAGDAHTQFFQGATEFEQTGLGLRIVKQIVDAHGWEIRLVESESNGARFEITGIELA